MKINKFLLEWNIKNKYGNIYILTTEWRKIPKLSGTQFNSIAQVLKQGNAYIEIGTLKIYNKNTHLPASVKNINS